MLNRFVIVFTLAAIIATVMTSLPVSAQTDADDEGDQTIVDIAVSDPQFSTLVTALQAADLVDALQGPGPFTVFAPTNDAFANLPPGTLDALLADIPQLTEILQYHVVPGRVTADQVVNLAAASTLSSKRVSISFDGTTVMINDANVIAADIEASNGIIHVIDTVLIPPTFGTFPVHQPTRSYSPVVPGGYSQHPHVRPGVDYHQPIYNPRYQQPHHGYDYPYYQPYSHNGYRYWWSRY